MTRDVLSDHERAWRHLYFDQLGERSIATNSPRDSNPFDHPPHVAFGVKKVVIDQGSRSRVTTGKPDTAYRLRLCDRDREHDSATRWALIWIEPVCRRDMEVEIMRLGF